MLCKPRASLPGNHTRVFTWVPRASPEPLPCPAGSQLGARLQTLGPCEFLVFWSPSFLSPPVPLVSGQIRVGGGHKNSLCLARRRPRAAAAAHREGFQWEAETERQRWRVKIARVFHSSTGPLSLQRSVQRARPRAAPRPTSAVPGTSESRVLGGTPSLRTARSPRAHSTGHPSSLHGPGRGPAGGGDRG